jgi:hypothetical protein
LNSARMDVIDPLVLVRYGYSESRKNIGEDTTEQRGTDPHVVVDGKDTFEISKDSNLQKRFWHCLPHELESILDDQFPSRSVKSHHDTKNNGPVKLLKGSEFRRERVE